MINPPVVEDNDNAERLAPFNTLQTMIIASKIADPSTNNSLPRNLMNLVGGYWLALIKKHEENVACLSALVEFMLKQGDLFNTDEIKGFDTALKSKKSSNNFYNTTFARVIVLIGDQKEILLRKAARDGNTLAVTQLLKIQDIDINAQDIAGKTALIWASMYGHTAVVTVLLKRDGILVNAQAKDNDTALMLAAEHGNMSVVTVLLKKDDILVNASNAFGRTALIVAARNGHTHVVTVLLKRDDILADAQTIYNDTALMIASARGYTTIVHQLCLKQLFDAPFNQGRMLFQALSTEITRRNRAIVFTTSSLCHHLLKSVAALPTTDEKIALLEKALLRTHAFSAVMHDEQRVQIEAALTALKPSQDTPPVIFSTAPVAGISCNAHASPKPN